MLKIGVTGGIGSGKSIVCDIFSRLGVQVYNSDARGKELTNSNTKIIEGIKTIFGEQTFIDGVLQRKYLASKVFADSKLLAKLNAIIHPVVANDFEMWCEERKQNGAKYIILESAILIESGFVALVDEVICVTAPIDIRIDRVIKRDGTNLDDVKSRINNQISDKERESKAQYNILNDDEKLILPQIINLNSIFTNEKL